MFRSAMTVMREGAVRRSRCLTETLGLQLQYGSCEGVTCTIPHALQDLGFPIVIVAVFVCACSLLRVMIKVSRTKTHAPEAMKEPFVREQHVHDFPREWSL